MFINKVLFFIQNPRALFNRKKIRCLEKNGNAFSDEEYLQKMFFLKTGKKLNLDNPRSYNEKLQWLKLYNRRPEYTQMVDKYLVRNYVSNIIGSEYLIPLLGVWDDPKQIDFTKLPQKFVLKCNHNSGSGMFICRSKDSIRDFKKIINNLEIGLKQDYFLLFREWPYKDVERKVICEQLLENNESESLTDYKFFCFDGKFKVLLVCTDRQSDIHNDWYDSKFNHLPFINGPKNRKKRPPLPDNIEKMVEVAEKLSSGIPHVRVDLYNIAGKIYFGEMTFFESSGFAIYRPRKYDFILGDFLTLPKPFYSRKNDNDE